MRASRSALLHSTNLGTELQNKAFLVSWSEGIPYIGAAVAIDPGHEGVGAIGCGDMVDEERGVYFTYGSSDLQATCLVGCCFEGKLEDEVEGKTEDTSV